MLGVEETVARLRGHLAALHALVLATGARIPQTSRLDAKSALADHLHDDATAAVRVAERIEELGDRVAERIEELGGGDATTAGPSTDADLIDALRAHVAATDPLVDEPTLRVLTEVLAHQQRHRLDPVPGGPEPGAALEPRDSQVQRLIAGRLAAADEAARAIAASPQGAPSEHRRLARRCWDAMRHVAALERLEPYSGATAAVAPADARLPGHENLLAHMLADDRRHERASG